MIYTIIGIIVTVLSVYVLAYILSLYPIMKLTDWLIEKVEEYKHQKNEVC